MVEPIEANRTSDLPVVVEPIEEKNITTDQPFKVKCNGDVPKVAESESQIVVIDYGKDLQVL